jgi:hypothetical protein
MQTDFSLFLEVKEVTEEGSFKGIASVYGVEDLTGDVIDSGAFRKTISESPNVPILWQHDHTEVIGVGTVKEWQGKIIVEGKLDLEDPTASKAHKKMLRGLIKGLSIGFQTVKSFYEDAAGKTVRHITELKLWEVSLVTFPALPQAQVTRVKSTEDLEAQVRRLEAEFTSLRDGGQKAVTATQTQTGEPARVVGADSKSSEPAKDHSKLTAIAQSALELFRKE